MRVDLVTRASSPVACFRPKVVRSPCTRHLVHQRSSLLSESCSKRFSTGLSINVSAAENFSEPKKVSSYIKGLACRLWEISPRQVKEFPWEEARAIAIGRLLILARKICKFSFIALFAISFASDVVTAVSQDRELMLPLGLFIGVALVDFLNASIQDFLESNKKDEDDASELWVIGLFFTLFTLLKLIILCFKFEGRLLPSLVGSGALMQISWLMKEIQRKEG